MLNDSTLEHLNASTPMRAKLEDGPNVTLLKLLQSLKHLLPNSLTLSGMLTDSIAVDDNIPANASTPMRSKLEDGPNVTLLSLRQ